MKKIILILTVFLLLIGCQKKMTSKQVVENYFNYINEKNEEGFNNLFAVPLKPEDTETLFKGIKEIKIKPEVVDPEDVEMLQDLILTCVNEALRKVDSEQAASLGKYNIPGIM